MKDLDYVDKILGMRARKDIPGPGEVAVIKQKPHRTEAKRILRHLKETKGMKLSYSSESEDQSDGFSDAD